MDELKVYIGKETIEALLEGKVLADKDDQYKLDGDILMYKQNGKSEWKTSGNYITVGFLLTHKFTEVVTPQVGDWVRVTTHLGNTRTGQVNDIKGNAMKAIWNDNNLDSWITLGHDGWTYETLSPEQVSEYKREQAFAKVRRKLNEFHSGDIVYIDSLAVVATVITKQCNINTEIKLHGINESGKGYTAKPHQLTPISFIEQQVDLS
ncbi:hypothetical protein [Bacillus phage 1_ICo-2020]|uniref:Uncharacterized protein n=1 Tax=Bacillus phage 1_ICo-2020 TaxID=2759272 RepID=A0A7G8AKH0_9CAUD|nr:hypothetical protein [Bacillus phage 1_ICo-2020]